MKIEKTGKYLINTGSGNKYEIEITKRDDELGRHSLLANNFISVRDFVNITVLKYL